MEPTAQSNADSQGPQPPAGVRKRRHATRRSVLIADKVADWTITVGGLFVIIAVFGIMVFLAEVVVPLFGGGEVLAERSFAKPTAAGVTLTDRVDEYKTLSVALTDNGEITAFHVGTGKPVEAPNFDFGGKKVTAFARTLSGNDIAFGFDDGTVRFARLLFQVTTVPAGDVPTNAVALDQRDRMDGATIYSTIPGGQFRQIGIALELNDPEKISDDGQPIVAIDYRLGGTVERPTKAFVTVDAGGTARLSIAESRKNLLTGKTTERVNTATLPELPKGLKIADILMTEKADQVYIAEASGTIYRYDSRDFEAPKLAEKADVVPGNAQLTTFGFLIGEQSIVVGDSTGQVDVYFRLQTPGAKSTDGYAMIKAHALEQQGAAITQFDASQRGKMFLTADASGQIWLRHSTSEQTLLKLRPKDSGVKYDTVVMAPRDDGVLAIGKNGRVYDWDISAPHPETTFKSIFGKIWYEGYPQPEYTWQSSSGTDSFEPKFSLVPLIFGTIKAAFYSLLFAIPLALAGAIYTSEFVHHRVRSVVKPTMEMMASLPSVVLGFIAALILAPIVETWIAAVLLAFVALPLSLLIAAYLWQMLPEHLALRYQGVPKFVLMFAVVALGVYAAYALGPAFEDLIFAGDLKAWANGSVGDGTPFTALLVFPAAFALVSYGASRTVGKWVHDFLRSAPRLQAGLVDVGRWFAMTVAAAVLSYLVALLLVAIGWDARGGVVDTYVQRNALVVGFAMGFAVIPIIYTIAEDALNAVPEHLRAASLACGATPWQTAISVILPTAVSGVFAAIMIGMGRAVGETMIVVMAAGNTPVLEWNVFSGLRALSANIAVELPEAVKDGTLYRMLFLAALSLFVMTFVVNTGAEIIRQRFRKRTAQL